MNPYVLAAATLFQAVGQINQASAQADAIEADAQVRLVETEQAVALEKASAAEAALDRARRLRQITGRAAAAASSVGVGVGSGTIGDLVEDSQSQFSREQGIEQFNVDQRTKSLQLSSQMDYNNLKHQASSTRTAGYFSALGTIGNFGARVYEGGWFSKTAK